MGKKKKKGAAIRPNVLTIPLKIKQDLRTGKKVAAVRPNVLTISLKIKQDLR